MKTTIKISILFSLLSFILSCKKNDGTIVSPAVVDSSKINDVLYIVSDIGKLAALDANTGDTKWTFVLDSNANINTTSISSSPTYSDTTVYIGSSDYKVYAIDAKTGTKKWSYLTDPITVPPYGVYYSSPIVSNGVLYIGGAKLYAINTNNGTLKWASALSREIASSPTIVNDTVYVSDVFNLYCLNALTGNTIAVSNGALYTFAYTSPCYYNNTLYDVCNYDDPSLNYSGTFIFGLKALQSIGFAAASNNRLSNAIIQPSYTSPTVKNKTLFVCFDSTLFAFDVANANTFPNLKWKFPAIGSFTVSSPTADSSKVYVGDNKGIFYAVNVFTGNLEWSIDTRKDGAQYINNSPH